MKRTQIIFLTSAIGLQLTVAFAAVSLPITPLLTADSLTQPSTLNPQPSTQSAAIDLDPKLIQSSPTLRRWLKQVPNVLDDIQQDPSFRTRVRLGYSRFPSTHEADGWHIGIEDVRADRTHLTLSADYNATFNGRRESWGTEARYYVGSLGSVVNFAPVIGYRHVETDRYSTSGLNLGARILLVPSRTGAADLSLSQTWVSPSSAEEVSLTGLSFGYAVTRNLRLSTDVQLQRSRDRRDSRFGIGLEWLL